MKNTVISTELAEYLALISSRSSVQYSLSFEEEEEENEQISVKYFNLLSPIAHHYFGYKTVSTSPTLSELPVDDDLIRIVDQDSQIGTEVGDLSSLNREPSFMDITKAEKECQTERIAGFEGNETKSDVKPLRCDLELKENIEGERNLHNNSSKIIGNVNWRSRPKTRELTPFEETSWLVKSKEKRMKSVRSMVYLQSCLQV
jgi:hypothetical protein